MSTLPMSRASAVAETLASTHTPRGVPSTLPTRRASTPLGTKSRRRGTKMTAQKSVA
jgi:hypothetical protein